MDAFEQVVQQILDHEGYWTRTSFKVELTKAEKRQIGRPSSPRWELDVVGYNAERNEILVVECKSYLNSPGVHINDLTPGGTSSNRYKLFNDATLRRVVLNRLAKQLTAMGLCAPKPTVKLALAAGNVVAKGASDIPALFEKKGFIWYGPDWIKERLLKISQTGYDNEVASVVSKLLLR
jgi:hypothetical protein